MTFSDDYFELLESLWRYHKAGNVSQSTGTVKGRMGTFIVNLSRSACRLQAPPEQDQKAKVRYRYNYTWVPLQRQVAQKTIYIYI